jgi:NADH-quinone oxidoreductase subunit H
MNQTIIDHVSRYPVFAATSDVLSHLFGTAAPVMTGILFMLLVAVIITVGMATIGGFGTYAERKISADIQGRLGPNRVGPFGLLQVLADGIKMISKEDISPKTSDHFLFYLAPFLCLFGVVSTFAVLPISSGFTLSDFNLGIFYLLAISSLVGLGIFIAGYASNSKWSLLGGMRGASQIISYEIPVVLSIMSVVLATGSLSFGDVVAAQGGMPNQWFIFHNPFLFVAFFILFIGIRFGLFALAEYMEIFVVSAVAATLFLGGYSVPFNLGEGTFLGQLLQIGIFLFKTLALYYVVIWIRWTFPRLRVDQLMTLCWKYLTPLAIFNLVGTAVWVLVFNGQSLWQILASLGSNSAGH